MATNPMQKRARNSFLLGMLIMLVISGAVIALLFMQLMNIQKAQKELEESYVKVYALNKDVESGQEVTLSDFTPIDTSRNAAPTNAVNATSFNEEGKIYSKLNLTKGTVVSADMLYREDDARGNDVRRQEYNVVVLPMDLQTGDYIDVRLLLPSGQDFIVVSKKQVEIPQIAGVDSTDTIWINLSEDEILSMSSAIIDAYMMKGAKLYATIYPEAGNQEAATPTYTVSGEVAALINGDPNILTEARNALVARYNTAFRENINSVIGREVDTKTNEETEMEESIVKSQTSREEYLQSLTAIPVE